MQASETQYMVSLCHKFEPFSEHLNNHHPDSKFTMKPESNNSLEVLVTRFLYIKTLYYNYKLSYGECFSYFLFHSLFCFPSLLLEGTWLHWFFLYWLSSWCLAFILFSSRGFPHAGFLPSLIRHFSEVSLPAVLILFSLLGYDLPSFYILYLRLSSLIIPQHFTPFQWLSFFPLETIVKFNPFALYIVMLSPMVFVLAFTSLPLKSGCSLLFKAFVCPVICFIRLC